MKLFFEKAWLPDGWRNQVVIETNKQRITDIRCDASSDGATIVPGYAVPGMTNVHSHAFQFAFAGLSEYRSAQHDSFWTWRKRMYEFLEKLTPDDVYAIGKDLYPRMLDAGYTTVGEFHYLMHQNGGTPYENVNEMADALLTAATESGIRICMLPVFYQRGGFDDSPLAGGQLRFGSTHDLYISMIEKLKRDWGSHPLVRIGVALHSLRAVSVEAAQKLLAEIDKIIADAPIHIHVAEQTKEVEDCLEFTKQRPVELLLNSFDINHRWCLIHATHLNDDECTRLANTNAVAGVCPTTEANLGDGIFRAEDWLRLDGSLAIGSDSHISVDPTEELRLLEYGQRLTLRKRAVLCSDSVSCGTLLYSWAAQGGASVTGFGSGKIAVNELANIGVLNRRHESAERCLDSCIFHPNASSHGLTALISAIR